MADNKLFAPKQAPVRSPTTNAQQNGRIVNPPRFAEFGGLKSAAKVGKMGKGMSLSKPGDTV